MKNKINLICTIAATLNISLLLAINYYITTTSHGFYNIIDILFM